MHWPVGCRRQHFRHRLRVGLVRQGQCPVDHAEADTHLSYSRLVSKAVFADYAGCLHDAVRHFFQIARRAQELLPARQHLELSHAVYVVRCVVIRNGSVMLKAGDKAAVCQCPVEQLERPLAVAGHQCVNCLGDAASVDTRSPRPVRLAHRGGNPCSTQCLKCTHDLLPLLLECPTPCTHISEAVLCAHWDNPLPRYRHHRRVDPVDGVAVVPHGTRCRHHRQVASQGVAGLYLCGDLLLCEGWVAGQGGDPGCPIIACVL